MSFSPTRFLVAALLCAGASPSFAAMREVTLTVPTMDCATCPVTIRVALLKVPGVTRAVVSYRHRSARVTYDDARTGQVTDYTGRETAPAAAGPDFFLQPDGKPMPFFQAVLSGKSTGAPGVVAMLARHGLRPAAMENLSPNFWSDILLDGPKKHEQMDGLKQLVRDAGSSAWLKANG